jgi:hypothetical protein
VLKPRRSDSDEASVWSRLRLGLALMLPLAFTAIGVARLEKHNHADFVHHRSGAWMALSVIGIVLMMLLTRFPSRLLAVAAGVLASGTLANLLWAIRHKGYVSNSFVLGFGSGGVAYNLADVFVLAGIVLLMAASIRLTVRHRHVLPRSTVAVRLARRVVALRR